VVVCGGQVPRPVSSRINEFRRNPSPGRPDKLFHGRMLLLKYNDLSEQPSSGSQVAKQPIAPGEKQQNSNE